MTLPVINFGAIPFMGILIVLFSLFYWIPSFFLVYHLVRFGIGARPKLIALVFLIGSIALFSVFVIMVGQLDLSFLFSRFFQAL